nr:hypothetical protein [Flavobacterium sp.]
MIPILGWNTTEVVSAKGLHPESEMSKVIDVAATFNPENKESNVYATVMLWKKSGAKWSKKELTPVKSLKQKEGVVIIQLNNGTTKLVDFNKN